MVVRPQAVRCQVGLDGFGVLEALGAERLPAVIFITAYDQFAVRAFEVEAIDPLRDRVGIRGYSASCNAIRKGLPA